MPYKFTEVSADIYDTINDCQKIETYIDGEKYSFSSESDEYVDVLDEMNDMLNGSHEMPAFGVSLDNETKEAMKSGVWIKLVYNKTYTHNEMTFDTLLIEVQKDWSGFNIYRGNKGIYEGRCFYINLVDNNMDILYDLVASFSQN